MKVAASDVRHGRSIDPGALIGYLRSHGWVQVQDFKLDGSPVALLMKRDEVEVHVPLLGDAKDYARLLAQLVNSLADVEGRPAPQVLADLREFRTDVVRVRKTGRADETLPLEDGASLFSSAHNLMVAASLAAELPGRPSYGGRRPNTVTKFLREAMFGQTEPGSFIVRVLVPLPQQFAGPQITMFDEPPPDPFGRKVTSTLHGALAEARRALVDSMIADSLEPFRLAAKAGVSVEFCRALSSLDDDDPESGLEVSLSWGLSNPRSAVEPVFFQRSDLQALRAAADFLAGTGVREEFELEGYITNLSRDPKVTEGDITVAATIDGQLLKVLVELDKDDYRVAGEAHTSDLKVAVIGDLGKEGRQHRLTKPRMFRVGGSG